jgi:OOP family OmpA-OmpF porin
MRIVKALVSLFFVTVVASGCASGSSTTIGGHSFNNLTCSLIGAAVGAGAGGAAANLGGAAMGALGGAVMAQYFCGEEEMMMEEVADADGDGVPDDADDCPYTPADTPNGCPADSDGDGVPDYLDECPDVPGDAETGCPPEPMETVFIESVHFDFDSAQIKSISKAVLDARAVPALRQNSDMRVRIEGHTDSVGPERYNQLLSLRRAEAVRAYLVSQGIDEIRMTVAGYGESNPIDTNDTRAGRANNRRVEFVIR